MKAYELRQKTKSELEKLLRDYKEKLRKARFDIALKQSKNVKQIRNLKKDIARILTVINQKNKE